MLAEASHEIIDEVKPAMLHMEMYTHVVNRDTTLLPNLNSSSSLQESVGLLTFPVPIFNTALFVVTAITAWKVESFWIILSIVIGIYRPMTSFIVVRPLVIIRFRQL